MLTEDGCWKFDLLALIFQEENMRKQKQAKEEEATLPQKQ